MRETCQSYVKIIQDNLICLFLDITQNSEINADPDLYSSGWQWRHNGHDGVSNHQPHDCLLNRLLRCRSKKTSKLRVTGLFVGNSTVTCEFPAEMASNAENVSIWWRHHAHRHSDYRYEPKTVRPSKVYNGILINIRRCRFSEQRPWKPYRTQPVYRYECIYISVPYHKSQIYYMAIKLVCKTATLSEKVKLFIFVSVTGEIHVYSIPIYSSSHFVALRFETFSVYPYISRLLHWHWYNHKIAHVPAERLWGIWINCPHDS